jgi:hypothetical protein
VTSPLLTHDWDVDAADVRDAEIALGDPAIVIVSVDIDRNFVERYRPQGAKGDTRRLTRWFAGEAAFALRASAGQPSHDTRAKAGVPNGTSGPSTVKKDHLVGGASRLAALLLPHILPVFSVVAPCQPGAALRDLVLFHRGRATSSRYALVALQGPAAREVLQTLTGITLGDIKYWFTTGEVAGVRGTVSRTGYTGEDGFEVFVPPASAERVWDAILQAGKVAGVLPRASARAIRCASRRPCVFTATTSTKSRRSWKRTSGGSSAGRKTISSAAAVLRKQKQEGVARRLVGFEMLDRAIGRHGYDVYMNGAKAGVVTSGTQTP